MSRDRDTYKHIKEVLAAMHKRDEPGKIRAAGRAWAQAGDIPFRGLCQQLSDLYGRAIAQRDEAVKAMVPAAYLLRDRPEAQRL